MDDGFPEGLRVLAVVDDDPPSICSLSIMLTKFQVNMCTETSIALSSILHAQEEFDIVITARNISCDMDGFKFVQQVRLLKKNLPIIMLLEGGEDKSMIEKGVRLGVDSYVIKPIREEVLRISILVEHLKKRKALLHNRTTAPLIEDAASSIVQHEHTRKRKTLLNNNQTSPRNGREESCGSSATPVKRPRLVWSNDLHHKFVEAVNQIGLDEARPGKIVELMKVEGLTRDNVSSHLQKYRLQIGQK